MKTTPKQRVRGWIGIFSIALAVPSLGTAAALPPPVAHGGARVSVVASGLLLLWHETARRRAERAMEQRGDGRNGGAASARN